MLDPANAPTKPRDHRPRIGLVGERHARDHLVRLGHRVVDERARTRWGEIDLITLDGTALVFCEVKTRIARHHESPWTSLTERKQAQVRRLAAAWLSETRSRPRADDIRFDAIEVLVDPDGALVRLDHLRAAF